MSRSSDRGSVTAEMAVAMPILLMLFLAGLAGINGVVVRLRCCDAARDIALARARGEDTTSAIERYAPSDATVSVVIENDQVTVVVKAPVKATDLLAEITVKGEAVAVVEPLA